MRLFVDVDETLVYAFHNWKPETYRPVNAEPDTRLQFPDEWMDIYLRGDIGLLKPFQFSLLSTGTHEYVWAVANFLRTRGFSIQTVYGRERVSSPLLITREPSLLIDNLAPGKAGPEAKMALLPNAIYCMVDAWETVRLPKKRDPDEPIKDFFKRRYDILTYVRSEGSKSLEDCLELAMV